MADENTIEIKLVGAAGGTGQTRPPAGSSSDTSGPAYPPAKMLPNRPPADPRYNPDLDAEFGVTTAAGPDAAELLDPIRKITEKYTELMSGTRHDHFNAQGMPTEWNPKFNEFWANSRAQSAAEGAGDQNRRASPVARRIPTARYAGDVDQETQGELESQRWKDVQREKAAAAKKAEQNKAAAEKDKAAAEKADREKEKEKGQKQLQLGQGIQQLTTAQGAGGKVAGLQGIASSGALGSGAAAALGPEVAAAAAVYDAAVGVIKQVGAGQREAIQFASNTGQNVLGNDYGAAAKDAAEGAANALERTGLAGVVLAESFRTATAVVNAFGEVVHAAVKRGKELEGYSATIAGAGARAEVRTLNADIREAQRNEQSYASITDSDSRFNAAVRDAFDPLKDAFVSTLAELAEIGADIATIIKPFVKTGAQMLAILIRIVAFVDLLPIKIIIGLIEWVRDWLKLGDKADEPPDLLQEIRKTVANLQDGVDKRIVDAEAAKNDKANKQKKPQFFGGR